VPLLTVQRPGGVVTLQHGRGAEARLPSRSAAERGPVHSAESSAALQALGRGGADDRVTFRLVGRLLARCLELLRPLRAHLLLFFAGFSALALAFVPIGVLLFDAFWTRVLQGHTLLAIEASALGLDPAVFAVGETLGAAERSKVLER